jgi:hypothetical protein
MIRLREPAWRPSSTHSSHYAEANHHSRTSHIFCWHGLSRKAPSELSRENFMMPSNDDLGGGIQSPGPLADPDPTRVHRACPICGTEAGHGDTKVCAPIRADSIGDQEAADYWRGFRSKSCFFDFAQCQSCGLLYNPTYFSQSMLDTLYSSMQDNTAGAATDVLSDTQAGYIDFLAEQRPLRGTYLEVGPDIGLSTAAAHATGRLDRSVLIEPNRDVYPQLRDAAAGAPVEIVASLSDLEVQAHADSAVLIHVLDHLIDPLAFLEELRGHLNDGALALFVVHNCDSMLRHALGVRWPPFCLQHPQLFSRKTLTASLQTAGFDVVASKPTTNVFPLRHAVETGASLVGLNGKWTGHIPDSKVRLRLGNIMAVARA